MCRPYGALDVWWNIPFPELRRKTPCTGLFMCRPFRAAPGKTGGPHNLIKSFIVVRCNSFHYVIIRFIIMLTNNDIRKQYQLIINIH